MAVETACTIKKATLEMRMAFKIYPLCIIIPFSLHFIDHNNNVDYR